MPWPGFLGGPRTLSMKYARPSQSDRTRNNTVSLGALSSTSSPAVLNSHCPRIHCFGTKLSPSTRNLRSRLSRDQWRHWRVQVMWSQGLSSLPWSFLPKYLNRYKNAKYKIMIGNMLKKWLKQLYQVELLYLGYGHFGARSYLCEIRLHGKRYDQNILKMYRIHFFKYIQKMYYEKKMLSRPKCISCQQI